MKVFKNQTFDEERAFYGSKNILVQDCSFEGPADGESAFKECQNIEINHDYFNLRYPFWHPLCSPTSPEEIQATWWTSPSPTKAPPP